MKRIITIVALATTLSVGATPDVFGFLQGLQGNGQTTEPAEEQPQQQQQSGGGILGGLGSLLGGGSSSTQSSSSSSQSTGGGILDGLTSLGTALGIIPEKTVDVSYLVGKWKYAKPAVSFQSDNFLQRAGGVAAAEAVESKLEPYYKTLRLNKVEFEFKEDSTFVMKVGSIKLNGTVETAPDSKSLIFHFTALGGRIPAGSMAAYVNAENNNSMALTFDVSKLVELATKVASITGNSTINTVSSLLNSYDGITAGFSLKRQ